VLISWETIELAFLAAIQFLPPRQRAILILRDVLSWPAKETASMLELSVASVGALQRARSTMRWRSGRSPAYRPLARPRGWVGRCPIGLLETTRPRAFTPGHAERHRSGPGPSRPVLALAAVLLVAALLVHCYARDF
jgi:hypothetical protein